MRRWWLQQRGWISAAWGVSDNNRKAKYYSITKAGKRQVKAERSNWQRLAAVIGRVLAASADGGNFVFLIGCANLRARNMLLGALAVLIDFLMSKVWLVPGAVSDSTWTVTP
jgi:hypothetical protein